MEDAADAAKRLAKPGSSSLSARLGVQAAGRAAANTVPPLQKSWALTVGNAGEFQSACHGLHCVSFYKVRAAQQSLTRVCTGTSRLGPWPGRDLGRMCLPYNSSHEASDDRREMTRKKKQELSAIVGTPCKKFDFARWRCKLLLWTLLKLQRTSAVSWL